MRRWRKVKVEGNQKAGKLGGQKAGRQGAGGASAGKLGGLEAGKLEISDWLGSSFLD